MRTVITTVNGEECVIAFASDKVLTQVSFKRGVREFVLTAEALKADPVAALDKLVDFFDAYMHTELTFVINVSAAYEMRIDTDADYVRFMRQNREQVFWSSEELGNAPEEILSAICAAMLVDCSAM